VEAPRSYGHAPPDRVVDGRTCLCGDEGAMSTYFSNTGSPVDLSIFRVGPGRKKFSYFGPKKPCP
jgi:hypothetical protein